jgi:hypothetical protein
MGQLVTRLGQLVAWHSETQIAKIGFASKFVAGVECASVFGNLRLARVSGFLEGILFGVRPPGAALARMQRYWKALTLRAALLYFPLDLTSSFSIKVYWLILTCCPLNNQPTQPDFLNQSSMSWGAWQLVSTT